MLFMTLLTSAAFALGVLSVLEDVSVEDDRPAQAGLDRVASRTQPTARRAEIAAAQARLQSEEVQAEKARMDEDRFKKLFEAGAATKVDYDNAAIASRFCSI